MAEMIGDLFPLAMGVALSPIPIIAIILLLLAPRAGTAGVGFLVGWVVGLAAMTTLVTLVAKPLAADEALSTTTALITLAFGSLVLMLGFRSWRHRPKIDEDPILPGWLSAVDHMPANRTMGLGLMLSAVIPKNFALLIAAGAVLGAAQISTTKTVLAGGAFVALSASGVLLPVVLYQILGARAERLLRVLRDWLTVHNASVMTILLTAIGSILVVMGISGLG